MSGFASEDDWVDAIRAAFPTPPPGVAGPGHDCAHLPWEGERLVVTTDVLIDRVHFDLRTHDPRAVAGKALRVNLSDLAAANAEPVGFEVGVVLPRDATPDQVRLLAQGFAADAGRFSCPCLGGDTNWADAPLVLAVTAFGRPGPGGLVDRSGARPGDILSVTGPLGGSRSGRHLTFTPRLLEAHALGRHGVPTAMMDLSDGLSVDLPRLLRASGVGAVVEAERVPIHTDVGEGEAAERLAHALDDGEDFELLLTHRPLSDALRGRLAEEGVTLFPIGRITDGEGARLLTPGGTEPLRRGGWDPVARPPGSTRILRIDGEAAMRALGVRLGRAIARSPASDGAFLALHGELGSGKTVLVQGLARGLGLGEEVVVPSPTFTIARSYPVPPGPWTLHHVDAYRLGGVDDLEAAGFEEMCGSGRATCVEWAERVEEAVPADHLSIEIRPRPGVDQREVVLTAAGPRSARLLAGADGA